MWNLGVENNDEIKSAMAEMTGEIIEIRQRPLTVDLVKRAIKVEEGIDRIFDRFSKWTEGWETLRRLVGWKIYWGMAD